jgi:hypothetical protein
MQAAAAAAAAMEHAQIAFAAQEAVLSSWRSLLLCVGGATCKSLLPLHTWSLSDSTVLPLALLCCCFCCCCRCRFKRGYKNVISKGVELNKQVR